MRLEYRILWIENDSDWKNTTEDMIKDEILEKGYVLDTTFYKDYNIFLEETEKKDYGIYDLILVDFKLDNDLTGDGFIEKVRNNNVLTDVLFYSQNSDELKDKFANNSLEGVYISNREDFEDKFFQVFRKTIKKLEELNAVRGLVMAETSRLDRLIEDILIGFFNSDDDKKEILKKYILKIIKKSLKDNFSGDELIISSKTEIEIVKSRVFDAYKKSRTLHKLVKLKGLTVEFVHDDYNEDVIKTRNELAHAKTRINNGVEYLLIDGGEKELKQEDIVVIRKNILKYDEILQKLKDEFKPSP